MALTRLLHRALGRRSVRARIALASAGLFLVTGAALVAATYALVDHSLAAPAVASQTGPERARLVRECHAEKANRPPVLDGPDAEAQCQHAIFGGVRLGAADQRASDLHGLLLWSLTGLGVATIVACVLGWAAGRRILLPLHTVTAAARRTSQEHLGERIGFDGADDELKELADTFDDMLGRLDHAFASQRRFVANAAHELRTPLTSARTLIDVAMAKPVRTTGQLEVLAVRVREALGQAEALIEGLLTLARSDRGLASYEPADLEAAAQDAIDQISPTARDSEIVIHADLSPSPALGDRILLDRLAANLLDNAVRYNVTGGSVRVVTGTGDGMSYITVTNTGSLVPESAVESLFEPFTRLDGRVGNGQGVGLGLSIVASVVNAHNGHLQAEALPNGGMTISARLPKPTGPA
ncbi:MAG TPA: ATP-binding protein [Acidimicrobiales bacterium]|nr:ATP-binding protein [Acidimicrobiales bacterium]